MKVKMAAIVCAYNEQATVENLVRSVCEIPLFDEVIVVNDGSDDQTGMLIRQLKNDYQIKDIHLDLNKGKGFAMAVGVENTNADYILFIDADLSNFSSMHASQLLHPLLNGSADLVIGQPSKTKLHPRINPFKKLSGQRALKREVMLPLLEKIKTSGYGVETIINFYCRFMKMKVLQVDLGNLQHPTKFEKTKPHIAIKEFAMEGVEIVRAIIKSFTWKRNVPCVS
jgi:glycosyltransferase involved in cell wall biosynthesis